MYHEEAEHDPFLMIDQEYSIDDMCEEMKEDHVPAKMIT